MVQLAERDENVTLFAQMEDKGGPVILINKFNVKPEEVEQLLKAWAADAVVMQQQPVFGDNYPVRSATTILTG